MPLNESGRSAENEGLGGRPILSIGLAVHNGEKHLKEAIDSLLAQDIADLELIVSDNASTDGTATICSEYAAADARVRYSRLDANIGGAANFNRVFELSAGRYFMWGSDDDVWDPRFARACIEKLERSPSAVLCTCTSQVIGQSGEPLMGGPHPSLNTEGMSVRGRVHEHVRRTWGPSIYGVFIPSALRATNLFLPTYGPDGRLLLEVLLLGDAVTVSEPLFYSRMHSRPKSSTDYVEELDPQRRQFTGDEITMPLTYAAREYIKVLRESNLDEHSIQVIVEDTVETLTIENTFWRDLILAEQAIEMTRWRPYSFLRAAIRDALGLSPGSQAADAVPFADEVWHTTSGMKLTAVRKLLLRLLRPFADRQSQLDAHFDDQLALLRYELEWLQCRVMELESLPG